MEGEKKFKKKTRASTTPDDATAQPSAPIVVSGTEAAPQSPGQAQLRKRRYVEKGSLTEAQLLDERNNSRCFESTGLVTNDDRMEERRAANRLSAFQSRQRRLTVIEDLQETVSSLTQVNSDQSRELTDLREKVAVLQQENDKLREEFPSSEANSKNPPSQDLPAASFLNPEGSTSRRRETDYVAFPPANRNHGMIRPPSSAVEIKLGSSGPIVAVFQSLVGMLENDSTIQPIISIFMIALRKTGTINSEIISLLVDLVAVQELVNLFRPGLTSPDGTNVARLVDPLAQPTLAHNLHSPNQ